jgi:predicted phosphoribosyltransferase
MESMNIIERADLHNRIRVFRDRKHGGEVLAQIMEKYRQVHAIVLAIPAGGVPVAAEIARLLGLPLDVAVVSKMTPPWSTEIGYGAVAFDGTVRLNHELVERLSLTDQEVKEGIIETGKKVRRRNTLFRGDRPLPSFLDQPAILVDDGLASGFTMQVAVEALLKASSSEVVVAVPTGPSHTVRRIAADVTRAYCANIRSGMSFAVADAYEYWSDVTEHEALEALSHQQTAAS